MFKSIDGDRIQILTWCGENDIQWKFIPPRAPYFGGLLEAVIKSANDLFQEIGHVNINQEDMLTLLAQIEMCLNSIPLTPIPTAPIDLEALTPGHFLVGSNLQAIPEMSLATNSDNRLDDWQRTQKLFHRI
ncbi:uncharacterized protein LOC131675881 [Topomyia yanbarensis]|uniref:uncharacterized protein LOC131675880 n=1 Tax=Topomyia yanbarensis TaxID=2498891 RepID=UPI00273B0EAA|nr:uncharacterized protein LOC131675880 [Topomyia yanbarensis]XP_058810998.1 uncharacterized protein LOC131675881 [Topomyia yanbarensis]